MEQYYTRCLKCNRKLKTLKARQRGYGDFCWKQIKNQRRKTLFDTPFIKEK